MRAFGNITIRTLAGAEFSIHASFDMGFYCFFSDFYLNTYFEILFKTAMRKP